MLKKIVLVLLVLLLASCNTGNGNGSSGNGFSTIEISGENKMHKVKLEKGIYLIDYILTINETTSFKRYDGVKIKIFDENNNAIDAFAPFEIDGSYLDFLYLTFDIPKDGTYYIQYSSIHMSEEKLVIKKVDYKSSFKEIKQFTSNLKGNIEGLFDVETYSYQNEEKNKLAKLTNNLNEEVYVIVKLGNSEQMVRTISPKGELYFMLEKGTTSIGFTHKTGLYDEMSEKDLVYSYDVNFEIVEAQFGLGLLGDMEEMTTEFSKNIYTVGLGFYDSCLSLTVEEEGIYKFESDNENNPHNFTTKVETVTGEEGFASNGQGSYYLPVGEYVIYLIGNDYELDVGRIKYTFYSTEDKEVQIEVPEVDFNHGNYEFNAVRQIENQKIIETQKIKYWFELKEKSHIFYDENSVHIFAEDGTPLSIPTYGQTQAIMVLDAGKYYFTTPSMSQRESIFFCKMNNFNPDYDYSLTNPVLLEENVTMSFNLDWRFDQELVKIVIKENAKVKIIAESVVIHVFDKDLKNIQPENYRERIFNLEAGEYYIRMRAEEKASIKYEIVG